MSAVLGIEGLCAALPDGRPVLRDVSLDLAAGEVRALVGESGAGKSMIGRAVLGILPAALRATGGTIRLAGEDLGAMPTPERRRFVARHAALIPQDPLTALNPVRRVGTQITEPLVRVHGWTRARALERAAALLEEVRIREPGRVMRAYPHELSGGMRQRVLIASAFASEPRLIVADEPTTALDVTVQREILRIVRRLQSETGTAVLFVTHDMGVVAQISQRTTVLFGGRVVEEAETATLFQPPGPAHDYTRALIAATPDWHDPAPEFRPIPPELVARMRAG